MFVLRQSPELNNWSEFPRPPLGAYGEVELERPRVRSKAPGKELSLLSWQEAAEATWLDEWAMNLILINAATRKFGRAVLHSYTHWIWWTLRARTPQRSKWHHAQFDTLRLHIIKLAAIIIEKKAQIIVTRSRSCPQQRLLSLFFTTLAPLKVV